MPGWERAGDWAAAAMQEHAALLLAFLAAAGNNVGKALQKEGTLTLPRLSLDRRVLVEYARSTRWLAGFLADIGGALLMVVAVANAPVSLVQPIAGSGLAVLALYAHLRLDERLSPADWTAVGCVIAGTFLEGLTADEAADVEPPLPSAAQLAACAALVLALLYGCHLWLDAPAGGTGVPGAITSIVKRLGGLGSGTGSGGGDGDEQKVHARPTGVVRRLALAVGDQARGELDDLVAGARAGALFGVSACATRLGFTASDSGGGALCAALGIACSVGLSAGGFYYQTRAFKDGRAVSVATAASVSSMLTGVVVGLAALGERMPAAMSKSVLRLLAWALLVVGIGTTRSCSASPGCANTQAGARARSSRTCIAR